MYNSHSLTHCCAWPAEGRSVLHIERSWPAIQAAPTDRPVSSSNCCSQFLPTLATHFSRAVPCKYTQYCLIVRTKFQNFSADNTLGPSMWEGVQCIRVWGWAPYWHFYGYASALSSGSSSCDVAQQSVLSGCSESAVNKVKSTLTVRWRLSTDRLCTVWCYQSASDISPDT